jgi:hypothetical protein
MSDTIEWAVRRCTAPGTLSQDQTCPRLVRGEEWIQPLEITRRGRT